MVDARSPPPGVAAERAELWLEGNSHSPLRVVCEEVDRTALGAPNVAETGTKRFQGAASPRRTERGSAAENARCAAQHRGSNPLAPTNRFFIQTPATVDDPVG